MARSRSQADVEAGPKSDAYTGLLALSLIALVTSCVILFLDFSQYGDMKPPKPNIQQKAPAGGGGPAPHAEAPMAAPLLPVAAVDVPMPVPALPVPAPAPATLPPDLDGPPLQ